MPGPVPTGYYYAEPVRDLQAMEAAARLFLGEHNFSNLARVGDKNPWRTILGIRTGFDGRFTYLEVTAHSFLWHQVRCMAAALFSVGIGEQDADGILLLLNEKTRRPIPPAPAEGLYSGIRTAGSRGCRLKKASAAARTALSSGVTMRSWSRCAGCSGRNSRKRRSFKTPGHSRLRLPLRARPRPRLLPRPG